MPITVQSLVDQIRNNGLDAQPNTDYYPNSEIFLAINSSVKWTSSVINKLRSDNKVTDEFLRELTQCIIFRTNAQSRIIFEDSVWTIDAVAPLPDTQSNSLPTPAQPSSPFQSWKRTDLVFVRSHYSAFRKTIQEANENRANPFSDGYMPETISQSDLVEGSSLNVQFSYQAPYNYQNPVIAAGSYIEILPEIPLKYCAVFLVQNPTVINAINQSIEFPESLFNIIYEKALNFLSYSQGDQTTLWQVTSEDLQNLIQSAR